MVNIFVKFLKLAAPMLKLFAFKCCGTAIKSLKLRALAIDDHYYLSLKNIKAAAATNNEERVIRSI